MSLLCLNWSTRQEDLRASHFVGLHGFQVIPLMGCPATGANDPDKSGSSSMIMVFGAADLMAGVMVRILDRALSGRPLVGVK